MFSFVALRRGGFFALQGIFLQWWAQSHKLFTIYTCPLLLLSAPSCFNKTTSCVSGSTLLICPTLNKLYFCLGDVEASLLVSIVVGENILCVCHYQLYSLSI